MQKRLLIVWENDSFKGASLKIDGANPEAITQEQIAELAPEIEGAAIAENASKDNDHKAEMDAEKASAQIKLDEVRAAKKLIIDNKQATIDTKNLKIDELRTEKQEALAALREEHNADKDERLDALRATHAAELLALQPAPLPYLQSPNGQTWVIDDSGDLISTGEDGP